MICPFDDMISNVMDSNANASDATVRCKAKFSGKNFFFSICSFEIKVKSLKKTIDFEIEILFYMSSRLNVCLWILILTLPSPYSLHNQSIDYFQSYFNRYMRLITNWPNQNEFPSNSVDIYIPDDYGLPEYIGFNE